MAVVSSCLFCVSRRLCSPFFTNVIALPHVRMYACLILALKTSSTRVDYKEQADIGIEGFFVG
jgi:hypothetical protein